MFLFRSFEVKEHGVKEREETFSRERGLLFVVRGANGFPLACVYCRDDLHKAGWSSDEARRIAAGIARLPELLGFRIGFYPHSSGTRWRVARPYHVALEDSYVRRHWDEIDLTCRLMEFPSRRPASASSTTACGESASLQLSCTPSYSALRRFRFSRTARYSTDETHQGFRRIPGAKQRLAVNKQAQLPQSGQ